MKNVIRNAVMILPLGLVLTGCAGNHADKVSDRSYTGESRTTTPPARQEVDVPYMMAEVTPPAVQEESSAPRLRHLISLEQIRKHVQNGTAVLIDARSPDQFALSHVRGAINVPSGQIEAFVGQVQDKISAGELIIIYCASSSCGAGDVVYQYLAAQGYTNMRVYKPGWQQLALAKNLQ